MVSQTSGQRTADLLREMTPDFDQLGRQVRHIAGSFLREHSGIFSEEWIRISTHSSSPGVSGALHIELEIHVPDCTLWLATRIYDRLEEFDPENSFSFEPPCAVSYEKPLERGRTQLTAISWVDYRYVILGTLLSLEVAAKTKESKG